MMTVLDLSAEPNLNTYKIILLQMFIKLKTQRKTEVDLFEGTENAFEKKI